MAELYRARWNQELDLRSIKTTIQMDVLRGKSPELVRKEIWTHLLAYNLIRTIIAQAAEKQGVQPRTLSFKGALQTLEAFQPFIEFTDMCSRQHCVHLFQDLLDAIAAHQVANRPGRFEPRKKKRRRMPYDLLMKPRQEEKLDMSKRVRENQVTFVCPTSASKEQFKLREVGIYGRPDVFLRCFIGHAS